MNQGCRATRSSSARTYPSPASPPVPRLSRRPSNSSTIFGVAGRIPEDGDIFVHVDGDRHGFLVGLFPLLPTLARRIPPDHSLRGDHRPVPVSARGATVPGPRQPPLGSIGPEASQPAGHVDDMSARGDSARRLGPPAVGDHWRAGRALPKAGTISGRNPCEVREAMTASPAPECGRSSFPCDTQPRNACAFNARRCRRPSP